MRNTIASLLLSATGLVAQSECSGIPYNVQVPSPYFVEGWPIDGTPSRIAHFKGWLQEIGNCNRWIQIGESYRWVSMRFEGNGVVFPGAPDTLNYVGTCQLGIGSSPPQASYSGFVAIGSSVSHAVVGNLTGDSCQPYNATQLYVAWDVVVSITPGDPYALSSPISIPNIPALIGTRVYHQAVLATTQGGATYYYTSELYELTIQ